MARRRRTFRAKSRSVSKAKPMLSEGATRYFRVIFAILLILFGGMLLGRFVVLKIIENADEYLYTDIASISMFVVSFLVAIVAWQGIGVIGEMFRLIASLATFNLGYSHQESPKTLPPNAWKMIPYAAITCAAYGLTIGIYNEGINTWVTAFDFGIAGAAWGVVLNFMANFRLLPYLDYSDFFNEAA